MPCRRRRRRRRQRHRRRAPRISVSLCERAGCMQERRAYQAGTVMQLSSDLYVDYYDIDQRCRVRLARATGRARRREEPSSATADNTVRSPSIMNWPGNQNRDNPRRARPRQKSEGDQQLRNLPQPTKTEVTARSAGSTAHLGRRAGSTAACQETTKARYLSGTRQGSWAGPHRDAVRSAIGFDQKRGDQVEVVNSKFAEARSRCVRSTDAGSLGMLADSPNG